MKYRILLVEDDEMMVEILKRNLEKWGYLARGITDFQNVMDEFQSFEPQLVLMDISLPFYNGYYWCGEIRKVSQVPVIFLSSSGDDMNLVMAIQLGADDFVAKPFRMDVLTAKIQAVLRRAYTFGVSSPEEMCIRDRDITVRYRTGTMERFRSLKTGKNMISNIL